MHTQIDQLVKTLISLTVMLMFTVAFIASQARATLPSPDSQLAAEALDGGFDTDSLRRLDSLIHLVDVILALPIDTDSRIGDRSHGDDAATDTRSTELAVQ